MRGSALAALCAAGCVSVSASAGAEAPRAPLALSASPTRLVLRGSTWSTVRVSNPGSTTIYVDADSSGFALDLAGRPHVAGGSAAAPWLRVEPRRLRLGAGRTALVSVSAALPQGAAPGERDALLLLRTRRHAAGQVPIVMQVGVVVVLHVRGRVVHRLEVRGLRVRRLGRERLVTLLIRNDGNVSETLVRRRLRVRLLRGPRLLATLASPWRRLLPKSSGALTLHYRGAARGSLRAIVELLRPRPGVAVLRRAFHVRF